MNLRTLKTRSKAAVPFLNHFGIEITHVSAKGESYHGLHIRCNHRPRRTRKRAFGKCECQWHPLKGTPMVGAMVGYYEPEWSERTAWSELENCLLWEGKPESMSDRDFEAAKKLCGITPAAINKHAALHDNI